jgi:hypothetical protein
MNSCSNLGSPLRSFSVSLLLASELDSQDLVCRVPRRDFSVQMSGFVLKLVERFALRMALNKFNGVIITLRHHWTIAEPDERPTCRIAQGQRPDISVAISLAAIQERSVRHRKLFHVGMLANEPDDHTKHASDDNDSQSSP